MTETNQTAATETNPKAAMQWTRDRAVILSVVCLVVGITGGWLIHGDHTPASGAIQQTAPIAIPSNSASAAPTPAQLAAMADTQAAPLIEKLKTTPNDADLLASIGNIYYDAQQYPMAIDYYGRALKVKPSDVGVRTDRGTAYWYTGNADAALDEFDKALSYVPNNANTLFNRGLVRWQGKKDGKGALADWEKLLATSPNYEGKAKVLEMMNEVKQTQK